MTTIISIILIGLAFKDILSTTSFDAILIFLGLCILSLSNELKMEGK